MNYKFWISLFFFFTQDLLLTVQGIGYIESDVSCDEKMGIDQALIKFRTTNSLYSLYGTNHICYKCSKTLIAATNNDCALIFTPHPFRLYILENNTNVMVKKDYEFGEHGEYIITYNENTNKITIDEEKPPIDSLKPLTTLLTVIIIMTFFVFLPTLGIF